MVGPLVTVFVVIGACVTRVSRGRGFLSCGPPSGETVLVIDGQRRLSNERIPSHPFGGSTRLEPRPPRPLDAVHSALYQGSRSAARQSRTDCRVHRLCF